MPRFILTGAFVLLALHSGLAADEKKETEEAVEAAIADAPGILVIGRRGAQGVPVVSLRSIGSRDVFGPERVALTGARDMNDLIQHLPALSTRPYNGGEAAAPSFSIRGLPDDGLTEYVHVLIDGVPASPLPYGWTAFSFLPITTERVYAVDTIRGAHAVRYSPNTVGGVLNFVTRPVPSTPSFESRLTFGSFDYLSALATIGLVDDGVAIRATYVDRRGDGYRRGGAFHQQDFALKARFELSDDAWLAASLSWMESEHNAPGGLTVAQFSMDRFANARPLNRFDGHRGVVDALLHLDADDGSWWEVFGTFSATRRNLRAQRPHFGTATTLSVWHDDSYFLQLGARTQQTVELFDLEHTVYAGVRYHYEGIPAWKLHSEPYPGGAETPTQDAAFHTHAFSAHLDDTFEPIENLTVQLGVRLEWIPTTTGEDDLNGFADFDDEFFGFLPGVGLSYAFSDQVAAYANAFRGFRAPQVWGYAYTPSDGALDFEYATSYEVGVRVREFEGFTGSAALWWNEFDDVAVFVGDFYDNLGKIEACGLDLVAEFDFGALADELDGFSVNGSITFQDSEIASGAFKGNDVPYAWKTKATWRLNYRPQPTLTFSLGGSYVGESYSDDANTSAENANGNIGKNGAWSIWDARVAKTFALGESAKLEVAVGATNLFDQEWEVHSRGGFFGGGLVAGPPRQLYGSVGFTLDW